MVRKTVNKNFKSVEFIWRDTLNANRTICLSRENILRYAESNQTPCAGEYNENAMGNGIYVHQSKTWSLRSSVGQMWQSKVRMGIVVLELGPG